MTCLAYHGPWGTLIRRGPSPSRGETARPKRLPAIQGPARSITLEVPDRVAKYPERANLWLERATEDWRRAVAAYSPGSTLQTMVTEGVHPPRVTVEWRPGDTDLQPTRMGRPGARIRRRGHR